MIHQRDTAKTSKSILGPIALSFALSACASNMPITYEEGSCMETEKGYALGGAITHSTTRWNDSCAHAMAAVMFAKMQSSNGQADLIGQAVAIEMYMQSNSDVQNSFQRLLNENDMDLDTIVENVRSKNGPVCKNQGNNEFVCM